MEPDYYKVLEVLGDAGREEIKASYRRAVRQHHPDAAPPEHKEAAHEKIQGIIAAWTVLGDPASRLAYDERRRRALAQAPANLLLQADEPGPRRDSGRAERRAGEPLDARKKSRVQAVMGGTSPPRPVNPRTRLLAMVFDAAQMYHVEGRPEEAARVCQQVLRADPTNAEAAVLLADIYAAQNQRAAALDLLERALRLQPANVLYRSKWEALRHEAKGGSPGEDPSPDAPPSVARTSAPNPWSKAGPQRPLASRMADRVPIASPIPAAEAPPAPAPPAPAPPEEPPSSGQPEAGEPESDPSSSPAPDLQAKARAGHRHPQPAPEDDDPPPEDDDPPAQRVPDNKAAPHSQPIQPEQQGEQLQHEPSPEQPQPARSSLLQRLRSKLSR